MTELKPCPFCGSYRVAIKKMYGFYGIYCDGCTTLHLDGRESRTIEGSIEKWNRRAKE